MKGTAELVIIGGGIMGASSAYQLVRRGLRKVILLEKEQFFGAGATGQNAGGIRHQFSTEVNIQLSRLSISKLLDFHEEMGRQIDLNFCGYLFLLDQVGDLERFERNVHLQRRFGVQTQLMDVDEIHHLVPQLDLHGILGGTFCPQDGIADPSGVVQGYIDRARELGATLLTEAEVQEIVIRKGRVSGVRTPRQEIACPRVLIAAGPWSGQVGRLAGIELPVRPIRRQIAVTAPLPGIHRDFPFVVDFGCSLYFHYEGGGILTGMSNPNEKEGFDTRVDEQWRLVHFEHAVRRLPMLENARLMAQWAGLYEVTPDHQPILGRLPQAEGLFACTGFSGHGFMHGPAAGMLLAEEILDGAAHSIDIGALRWNRFEQMQSATEYNVV